MHEIIIGLIVGVGGSIINFGSTKLYNHATGASKNFVWQEKYKSLKSFKIPVEYEELKRRIRIVIIDDEDSFPTDLFKTEGYNIERWNKVLDYGKLENGFYDIIILDIKGVATHISEDDGLGVLESIKKNNIAQIIIAYSQHSFDLSKARFWELADEKIAKPSDFLKIKQIIDNLITSQFIPNRYIDALHGILRKSQFTEKEIKKFDSELIKMIKKGGAFSWDKILQLAKGNVRLASNINIIGSTLLKFYR